ncbi:MAG: NYN domain-containing protein [Oscillospiraceae bacterium]|nr:NYN domain-containing protein [Oscillospiraceae bacterium]MDD4367698.1 NYN domain-containing protein [Oscillospiraceae bacterium]
MQEDNHNVRLAVLIDADNISYHYIKGLMQEVALLGTPTIKRIYGDWTRPNLSGWKPLLLDYAITPVQQFGYTYGKNATDSALIIDAMDILYAERVDGFCLVSSDSDFTRLATRLREAGKVVYGIGEQKTPNAFIAACDKFIYIEILNDGEDNEEASLDESADPANPQEGSGWQPGLHNIPLSRPAVRTIHKVDDDVKNLIYNCIMDLADEQGWAFLGDVGNLILRVRPSFDPRNYGYSKLTPLIRDIDGIEIDERATGQNNVKHIYIRLNGRRYPAEVQA